MMWCKKRRALEHVATSGAVCQCCSTKRQRGSVSSTHRRRQQGRRRASTDMKSHDSTIERTSDGSEAASARMSPPGLTAVAPPGSVRLVVGSSTAPSLPVLPAPADGEIDFKGFCNTPFGSMRLVAASCAAPSLPLLPARPNRRRGFHISCKSPIVGERDLRLLAIERQS